MLGVSEVGGGSSLLTAAYPGHPSLPVPFLCAQYYTCTCILGFVACSVFLRMSLELKVLLLTVALVAYLLLFNLPAHFSLCWQQDCCGSGLGNLTQPNGTLR